MPRGKRSLTFSCQERCRFHRARTGVARPAPPSARGRGRLRRPWSLRRGPRRSSGRGDRPGRRAPGRSAIGLRDEGGRFSPATSGRSGGAPKGARQRGSHRPRRRPSAAAAARSPAVRRAARRESRDRLRARRSGLRPPCASRLSRPRRSRPSAARGPRGGPRRPRVAPRRPRGNRAGRSARRPWRGRCP